MMKQKIETDTFETSAENVLKELEELFYATPPVKLKEHLLEVFFTYLIEVSAQDYPINHREITEAYYSLIMFLTKMQKLNERSDHVKP